MINDILLSELQIRDRVVTKLAENNIFTIGDLRSLTLSTVRDIFRYDTYVIHLVTHVYAELFINVMNDWLVNDNDRNLTHYYNRRYIEERMKKEEESEK